MEHTHNQHDELDPQQNSLQQSMPDTALQNAQNALRSNKLDWDSVYKVPEFRRWTGCIYYVEDVSCNQSCLLEDESYELPLVPMRSVVVFPGMLFPLLFGHGSIIKRSIEHALAASPPLRGLVAVFDDRVLYGSGTQEFVVGCIAEIKQLGTTEDNQSTGILLGKQRVQVRIQPLFQDTVFRNGLLIKEVITLSDALKDPKLPSEIKNGMGYWPRWIVQSSDPFYLANLAFEKAKSLLDHVTDLRDDPRQFSFWLACGLPISHSTRQKLLEEPNSTYRLRHELNILSLTTGIFCGSCNERLGELANIMTASEMAPSQIFVNANGFAHDLMLLKRVSHIALTGQPTTEYSWFPGYSWVIAHCPVCLSHVGWEFKATNNDLIPSVFWGFSRSQIRHRRSLEDDEEEEILTNVYDD